MESYSNNGTVRRKFISTSVLEKMKKKKSKKRKSKEGKRSSASNVSADTLDIRGRENLHKTISTCSCPSRFRSSDIKIENQFDDEYDPLIRVNESLRWPAHTSYSQNTTRLLLNSLGRFPLTGKTDEEEDERIAIYKMNRRKRYLAAQQALLDKYPDGSTSMYVSSSGSSSATNPAEDIHSSNSSIGCTRNNSAPNSSNSMYLNSVLSSTSVTTSGIMPSTQQRVNPTSSSHIHLTTIPLLTSASKLLPQSGMQAGQTSTSYNPSDFKIAIPITNGGLSREVSLIGSHNILSEV